MPVYKDKVRGTWFYEGSFINILVKAKDTKNEVFKVQHLLKKLKETFL